MYASLGLTRYRERSYWIETHDVRKRTTMFVNTFIYLKILQGEVKY